MKQIKLLADWLEETRYTYQQIQILNLIKEFPGTSSVNIAKHLDAKACRIVASVRYMQDLCEGRQALHKPIRYGKLRSEEAEQQDAVTGGRRRGIHLTAVGRKHLTKLNKILAMTG